MSAIILEVNPCFKSVGKTEVHQILGSKPEGKRPFGGFRRRRDNGSTPELEDANRDGVCVLHASN